MEIFGIGRLFVSLLSNFAILIITLAFCVLLFIFCLAWLCLFRAQIVLFETTARLLRDCMSAPVLLPGTAADHDKTNERVDSTQDDKKVQPAATAEATSDKTAPPPTLDSSQKADTATTLKAVSSHAEPMHKTNPFKDAADFAASMAEAKSFSADMKVPKQWRYGPPQTPSNHKTQPSTTTTPPQKKLEDVPRPQVTRNVATPDALAHPATEKTSIPPHMRALMEAAAKRSNTTVAPATNGPAHTEAREVLKEKKGHSQDDHSNHSSPTDTSRTALTQTMQQRPGSKSGLDPVQQQPHSTSLPDSTDVAPADKGPKVADQMQIPVLADLGKDDGETPASQGSPSTALNASAPPFFISSVSAQPRSNSRGTDLRSFVPAPNYPATGSQSILSARSTGQVVVSQKDDGTTAGPPGLGSPKKNVQATFDALISDENAPIAAAQPTQLIDLSETADEVPRKQIGDTQEQLSAPFKAAPMRPLKPKAQAHGALQTPPEKDSGAAFAPHPDATKSTTHEVSAPSVAKQENSPSAVSPKPEAKSHDVVQDNMGKEFNDDHPILEDPSGGSAGKTSAPVLANMTKSEIKQKKKVARAALTDAWFEREEIRKRVASNYSFEDAKKLQDLTKLYSQQRESLQDLMSTGVLNDEDAKVFPVLGASSLDVPKNRPQGIAEWRERRKSSKTDAKIADAASPDTHGAANERSEEIDDALKVLIEKMESAKTLRNNSVDYFNHPRPRTNTSILTLMQRGEATLDRATKLYGVRLKALKAHFPQGMPPDLLEKYPEILED